MAVAAVATLPIAVLIQFAMYRDADAVMARYVQASEAMNGALVEYVRAMPVIKVFNANLGPEANLRRSIEAYRDLVTEVAHRVMPYWSGFNVAIRAGVLAIMPLGVLLVLHGSLSVPVFVLFLLIGVGIAQPALRLIFASSLLRTIEHGTSRLFHLLDAPDLPEPVKGCVPDSASVAFEDVWFSYGSEAVLEGVSFHVESGTTTAIVGPSGAGKSTIVQLLARFWDPEAGSVRIGDVDLRLMSSATLNDWISFVFQDVFLFDDSLMENIRAGSERASDDEVIAAAGAAGIDQWIGTLPDGYRSRIGERGSRLSGGQRQCVSIARALLRNTPIIVLDEFTAFADAETESRIAEGLRALTRGKTVLAITHRLSTARMAKNVLVLDRGRVVAQGSHTDLVAENDVYRMLFAPDGPPTAEAVASSIA
jgi:ATP-binding cassette subfamily B protein